VTGGAPAVIPLAVDGDINTSVRRAAAVLGGGGVILYPTDTIYGLGCRAADAPAIRRIYTIKGRPETRPSLILVGSVPMAERFAAAVPPLAATLMEAFWPGPLTLLFSASAAVPGLLTAGTGKIGIRFPANEFCSRLSERCDDAIVSTSANLAGQPPLTGAAGLVRVFGSAVDLVVDAGELDGSPSTIADVSGGELIILREGAIPGTRLVTALGRDS